jgi:hypothetical protein
VHVAMNKDLAVAARACGHALQIQPSAFTVLDSRAFLRFRQGDMPGALADSEAALALKPQNPLSLYIRGMIKIQMGKAAEGKADMDAARNLGPAEVKEYEDLELGPRGPAK